MTARIKTLPAAREGGVSEGGIVFDRAEGGDTMSNPFDIGDMFGRGNSADERIKNAMLVRRVDDLEQQVKHLSLAILVLLNSKEKRSQATLPSALMKGASVECHWETGEADGKRVCVIRVRTSG